MLNNHAAGESRWRTLIATFVLIISIAQGAATVGAVQENAPPLAFVGVNVVPMDRERVLMRQTVVVQGDRIMAIGPSDEASIPNGVLQLDARGKYLIPGLIDVHAGLLSAGHIAAEFIDEELAVIVANGVTTILNSTGRREYLRYRDQIAQGELLGPRLYVATPRLTLAGARSYVTERIIESPTDAVVAVRELSGAGYDFVQLGSDIDLPTYDAIVLAARQYQIRLAGSIGPLVGLQRGFETGQQIEHYDQYIEALISEGAAATGSVSGGVGGWQRENWASLERVDEELLADVVRATVDAETWNAPMLALGNVSFGAGRTDEEIAASPEYRFVSPTVRAELLRDVKEFWADPPPQALRARFVELRNRITLDLYRAGGRLLVGSGSPEGMFLHGFAVHRELESFVDAGLPPFVALHLATRNAAVFLSRPRWGRTEFAIVDERGMRFSTAITNEVDFGVLGVGKRADMVLLAANPLDDISNTRRIEGVVLRGRWMPGAELEQMLAAAAAALSEARLLQVLR